MPLALFPDWADTRVDPDVPRFTALARMSQPEGAIVAVAALELTRWTSDVPSESTYHAAARAVAADLRRRTRADVRFTPGDRALYATDLSVFRQVPIGVVIPTTTDDVIETVAVCREHDVPILPRGAGTSLAGQTCNLAVVIDFSKHLHQIVEYDPEGRSAVVQPGVICDQLRHRAWKDGLTWAPDPATHAYNTFGGMIGNNSCGTHSLRGGKTVDNIETLDILTYGGERLTVGGHLDAAALDGIIHGGGARGDLYAALRRFRDRHAAEIRARYPNIPRRVSGYNLDDLLPEKGFDVAKAVVGSEGTLAVVLGARVRLLPRPPARALVLVGFDSMADAGDHVPELLELEPQALEGVHESVTRNMRRKGRTLPGATLLPDTRMCLILEFGGASQGEANGRAEAARRRLESSGRETRLCGIDEDVEAVWKVREAGVGASRVPHTEGGWPCWEDTAVHPSKEGAYLREFEALLARYQYPWTGFGHFGQGCFHIRIGFDFSTHEGVAHYRGFATDAADLVVKYGGSLSGEHGDGQARAEFLPKMFGPEIAAAFREYKRIWDPRGRMNPGKLVDPYPIDSNLRVGPEYHPVHVRTHFRFAEDRGSFAAATQRCFGVGKCRELAGQETMCPSFQVLRDEQHTTRGRAHLLFEALRDGSPIARDGLKSDYVRESLDLCLACKGCKHDCPESVDIASYKAEFLSHYFARRLRPRQAYAFALIEYWAKLASFAPDAANVVTQTPGLRDLAKFAARVAPERRLPAFASRTFEQWWRQRRVRPTSGTPVILWPDTYNNHFHPTALQAAAEVLEDAGCRVIVPDAFLPLGRPLYDWGMLDLARWQLERVLHTLKRPMRESLPLIVLEPSDASVLRHELLQFFPDAEDARALASQTFTLPEFLLKARGWPRPRLERKAVVHVHCHQRAVLDTDGYLDLLKQMGIDADVPDRGCCGMAGPFGFEDGQKHTISIARAEQALLPAVREAAHDAIVIADGFSCRQQIAHLSDRRALHIAEVIRLAQRSRGREAGESPEREWQRMAPRDLTRPTSTMRGAAMLGGAAVLGAAALAALVGPRRA